MRSLRRILIVHPYGIGDLLFITPILRALRLLASVEKVDLLLGSRTREVIAPNPHIDEIFVVDKDHLHQQSFFKNFCEMYSLGKRLKKNRYDLLLDFSLRREYAFFSQFYFGIPRRAGFDYKGRGCFHNIRMPLPEGFTHKHVIDYYAELAEQAGIPVEHRQLELYLSQEAQDEAQKILGTYQLKENSFLIVAPGGGESWGRDAKLKRWSIDKMASFVNQLPAALMEQPVVIVGSKGEAALAAQLQQKIERNVIDLTGQLAITVSCALLQKAQLLIGNDGGLVHMAHALRRPLIALYGPAEPTVYGPSPQHPRALVIFKEDTSCRPCYKKFRYHTNCRAMEELSVSFALDVVQKSEWVSGLTQKATEIS